MSNFKVKYQFFLITFLYYLYIIYFLYYIFNFYDIHYFYINIFYCLTAAARLSSAC